MIMVSLDSYAKKITFLSSSVVPAARGYVKVTRDKNENYVIQVQVLDLAEVNRLQPSKHAYVVWILTDKEIINNLVKSPIPAISGSEAEIYHLTIINDLEKIVAIDKDVLNTSDYVVVYSDISAYNDVENDLMENLDSMDTLLGINR